MFWGCRSGRDSNLQSPSRESEGEDSHAYTVRSLARGASRRTGHSREGSRRLTAGALLEEGAVQLQQLEQVTRVQLLVQGEVARAHLQRGLGVLGRLRVPANTLGVAVLVPTRSSTSGAVVRVNRTQWYVSYKGLAEQL